MGATDGSGRRMVRRILTREEADAFAVAACRIADRKEKEKAAKKRKKNRNKHKK